MTGRRRKIAAPAVPAPVLLSGRQFESVFRPDNPSREGLPRFRIAGSGVRSWPMDASATSAMAERLQARGFEIKQRSMGSAGNADSYHLDVDFLDGGLHATTGKYWFGEKGAWIHGHKAVAWVARELGLRLPGALRRRQPPTLDASLVEAYRQTDFIASGVDASPIRIGQPAPSGVEALLRAHQVQTALFVTAFNPFSVPLAAEVNELRQRFLRFAIEEEGLYQVDGEGRDPTGQWPSEPSLVVLGVGTDLMQRLLLDYQQHAVVLVLLDAHSRLVLHPARAHKNAGDPIL